MIHLNGLELCVDRPIPVGAHHPWKQAFFRHDFASRDFELAAPLAKKWPNGGQLQCCFLGGTAKQRRKVESIAHEWEQFANLAFRFGSDPAAEIRICFDADPKSWSAVGTDALNARVFPKTGPTMNLGWLRDDTPAKEARRVVLHEFGHALGAIHEHQQPSSSLPWNREAVIAAYSGPPNNWTPRQIEFNIIRLYSRDQLNWSQFDARSIMLYHFPAALFRDFAGTPLNTELSPTDRKFISFLYPK